MACICGFKKSVGVGVLVLILIISACKGQQTKGSVSKEIKAEIELFGKEKRCDDAKVNEHKFQNKLVYVFEEGTCLYDKETNVRDSKGKLLGSLGGMVGNTLINGEDFSSAVLIRTVWMKE